MTRNITQGVARIKMGLQSKLLLGNLDAERDWGYAPEYVHAMWLMLQADEPDDFVVATGTRYSVRQFAEMAFSHVGLDWRRYVDFDERFLRPAEVDSLVGDATKAQEVTGWKPRILTPELAALMVDADMRIIENSGTAWVDEPRFI